MNRFRPLPMLAFPVVVFAAAAEDPVVARAQEAAQVWLALADQGRYGQSWEAASALFRGAIPRQDWETAMASVRSPLGAVLERKRTSATFARTLPGAPDGNYVVIQYETRFAHKASAIETITPMLEPDGSWKVSGYYIR